MRTVQHLVDMLGPGQTGCLRGTSAKTPFVENVTIANKNSSGSSEADRIKLTAYPGEVAKLRGALTIAESANFITVSDLVLQTRVQSGASPRIEGDEVVMANNNVYGSNATSCFRIGATAIDPAYRTTLDGNRIHDCDDAVLAASTTDLLIENNLIYDNTGWGVRLEPNVKATGVTHNILDNNGAGLLLGGDATRASTGAIVDHDIISNSSPGSWNLSAAWDPLNVPPTYSSFVTRICSYDPSQPGNAGINDAAGGFMNVSPIVNQDPQYRNAASKDFHIDSSSPCSDLAGDIAQTVEDGGTPNDQQALAAQDKPNVLFIVTDDQRADGTITQSQDPNVIMPAVVDRLEKMGTTFSHAFVPTPLCCPSRASIMSGRYAHNTVVSNNFSAWNFDEAPTLQAYLHDESNYRTGIFGKYLNDWDLNRNPQHWDEWGIFNQGYCPFRVNENGTLKNYGIFNQPTIAQCGAYTTTYVRDMGLNFLDQAEADDTQPWFLYLAPFAPHGPASPDDPYASTDVGTLARRAVHDEGQPGNTADPLTDKPDWVQGNFEAGNREDSIRTNELRTLKSVDDMVQAVMDKLKTDGEQDTLIVFMGDNGFQWGEHGLVNKSFPYTESINVPLVVRYAPVTIPDSTDSRMVQSLDLTPTALKLAGLSTTNRMPPIDGLSLFDPANNRSRLLFEYENHLSYPDTDAFRNWASTRTATYQYIESYAEDGATVTFREYYDLVNDPDEQFNLYGPDGQPGGGDDLGTPAQDVNQLSEQLRRDRLCVGTACPPGPGASASATDTTPPSVELRQPSQSAYVCCRVKLTARAVDNLGVAGLQFQVDGNDVGPELTTEPFQTIWDTTGVPAGQHTITAVARDAAGNTRSSAPTTVNRADMDVQMDNGPTGVAGKPDTGDTITFSFGRPINPATVALGWDGAKPSSCAAPAPPGCVTVGILPDSRYDETDMDSVAIYKDPQRTVTDPLNQQLTSLGTVDLGAKTYVAAPGSFLRSPMELVDGGTAVRITLQDGTVAAGPNKELATMQWSVDGDVRDMSNTPFCVSCRVFESIIPWVDPLSGNTIDDDDREF